MVTTNIGKIFLQAYNVKYEKNYTAKDFFDKVFFKGHKTKCNKMEDDRKRLYTLIFNQLGRN